MNAAGYGGMKAKIDGFNGALATIGVTMPAGSPLERYFRIVAEFLADHDASPDEAAKKWVQRDFHEWYLSMLAVDTVCEAVVKLATHPATDLVHLLKLVLSNDISQDYHPSQSKDFLYEMQVALWFQDAGFTVELAEPDLRVSGNGLSTTLGVACKNPSSKNKINRRISDGYEQICTFRDFVNADLHRSARHRTAG